MLALLALRTAVRRSDALAAALGLAPDRRRRTLREALPLVALALLLSLAAAQPVLSTRQPREGREGVEVIAVVDVTRSMLARRAPSEPTRLDRARAIGKEVRAQLPEIEFGIASITDRVLPHLFPTLGINSFAATIDRAIGIERPPADRNARRATALGAIADMARLHFFEPATERRIVLVLSDGETVPVDLASFRTRIVNGRVATIFVHVWRHDERVFENRDAASAAYQPDPTSVRSLRRIAGAVDGGLYTEGETAEIVAEIERLAGRGSSVSHGSELKSIAIAPHVAAAAFLPLLVVLRRRNL